jgi:hypothetical protein
MPFKSKNQAKACFASKGFGGKVDCGEWMHKTKNFNKLPEKTPYKEEINRKYVVRTFSENIDSEELKWHKDLEDRIVIPLSTTDWMFQRDNGLPEKIVGKIKIKANEWHRVIKGTGELKVKIYKS